MAQSPTPVPVLTWRYDLTHAGQNTQETALTPANVASSAFGKLFSVKVDDRVFAQPLYVPNLKMNNGQTHNVLFIATENNTIYAFDADTKASPIWQINLSSTAHGANPGATPVPQADVAPSEDIGPNIGITGTPAIDPATNTMYVVANTKEGGQYYSRLHAIDITSGAEQPGSPVAITATVSGTGDGSSGGQITFSPLWTNQRAALNFYNGYVYIAYSSHGDISPYHGWLFAYKASPLQQTAALCLSPQDLGASVWGSGAGLPIDTNTGKMFVVTGNGNRNSPFKPTSDYGESVIAFNLANGQLTPTDTWTAFNYLKLNTEDWDQGSGGLVMLPDQPGPNPHLILTAGKEGRITLLNRDNLGGLAPSGATSNTNAVQDLSLSAIPQGDGFWGTAAYWNGNVYVWAAGDDGNPPNVGMHFTINSNGQLSTTPKSETTFTSSWPAPTFSASSNGTQDGILWAIKTDQFNSWGPAVLYAFDPDDLSNILYQSDKNSGDAAGPANKFAVPVVTNGKVYVATNGEIDVYGLTGITTPTAAAPTFNPNGGTFSSAQSVTISSPTPSATIYYTLDGTAPTTSSTQYSGAITVSQNTTIKAIATAAGYTQSSVSSATFTFSATAPPPPVTFNPAGGTYTSAQTVTLSDSDSNATIYYTTDGSTPTTSSTKYTGPITVSASETINAIAVDSGTGTSTVSSAAYTINAPPPPPPSPVTFSPAAGTYTSAQTVTLSDTDSTATIYYTTDGSTPTTSSTKYSSPINVAVNETISAIAVDSSTGTSTVASAAYVINTQTSASGSFAMAGTPVTISGAGSNANSTVTITPSGGFTGTVYLTCAVTTSPANAVDPPTCTATQPQAITGSGAVTTTVTISTTAASSASLHKQGLGIGAGATFAALVFLFLPRRRRAWHALLGLLLLAVAVVTASGCGASNVPTHIQGSGGGTTPGAYVFTVTGTAGTTTASATIDVLIN